MSNTNDFQAIEVLIDGPDGYAHIDRETDQVVATYPSEMEASKIVELVKIASEAGFYWLKHHYYDTDLQCEVAVFGKERNL